MTQHAVYVEKKIRADMAMDPNAANVDALYVDIVESMYAWDRLFDLSANTRCA